MAPEQSAAPAAGETGVGGGTSRWPLFALAALTVLAFALRVVGIDQTLYADEYFTHDIVTGNGLGGVWHDVFHTSITPPLHYGLAWLTVQFGGDSTVLIRLPSLLFGTALVPLVFALGRRIRGDRAGLLAAALIALGPFAIWYSDEARAYATMMFLVALSTYAMLRALDGRGRWWWVVYALSACAALWSHYTAVFVVVAEAAWALWTHRERWRALVIVQAAIAIGYLPWLPGFLEQRRNNTGIEIIGTFAPLGVGDVFRVPLQTLIGHPFFRLAILPGAVGLVLVAVLVVLAGVAVVRRRGPLPRLGPLLRSEPGLVAILVLATPVGLLLYAVAGSSLYLPRNLSASLPALALLVGLLVDQLVRAVPPRLALPATAVFVAILGVNAVRSLNDDYRRPPFREAARYIDDVASSKDPVVDTPLYPANDKRFRQTTLGLYFTRRHPLYPSGANVAAAWDQLRAGRDVYLVASSALLEPIPAKRPDGVIDRASAGLRRRTAQLGGLDGRAVLRASKTFAGIIPVEVRRYAGLIDGRLERRGGQEIVSWSLGKRVSVNPGVVQGSVDIASRSNTPLLMGGWALDSVRHRPVDWVLFFFRGRLLAVSPGGSARPEIARAYGAAAFRAGFAIAPRNAPSDHSAIRVFAIVGDRASELPFSAAARRAVR